MRSNNPVFNPKTLEKLRSEQSVITGDTMTVAGTINKTGILVLLMVATSIISWNLMGTPLGSLLMISSLILNLVLVIALIFKKHWAPVIAPVYALAEGFLIGAVSAMANQATHGVAQNAMILTFSILFTMLGLYHWRILQATETFKKVIMVATLGIFVTYMVNLVMGFFGHSMAFIHEASPMGIGFSLVVVAIAAFNFILDFDMIEQAANARAPKYMEWYGGFAVLVTLVWLYLEILRLLAKLSSRK